MPKTRVIELYLDNTYEDKKVKFDVNELNPRKKEKVKFEPICVFHQRKKRGLFSRFRGRKSLILYVNGAYHALKFGKVTEELQALWNKKESKEFVKKEIAKAHMEQKPMTWTQFFIILAVNAGTLLTILLIAQRLRVF